MSRLTVVLAILTGVLLSLFVTPTITLLVVMLMTLAPAFVVAWALGDDEVEE